MKPSQVIIVIILILSINNVLSQKLNGNTKEYVLYIKAGYELSNFSNVTTFKMGRNAFAKGGAHSMIASIGVEYTRRLAFELQFKYMESISYAYDREAYMSLPDGTKYYLYGGGIMDSRYINLRANYFVNEDRRENPVYFIGALNIGFQNVRNSETKEYPERTEITITKYPRYVIGPEAGLGIYFDLGIFNFVFESTFGARIPLTNRDRNYAENSITLNFSPVLKY